MDNCVERDERDEDDVSIESESCEVNEEVNELCPICKDTLKKKVIMSCAGMHTYCFDCIIRWIESKGGIICPECRKHCDTVIIPKIEHSFLEAIRVLPNPCAHSRSCTCFDDEMENTCVYPSWVIDSYIFNREQLKSYNILINEMSPKKAKQMIHWK